MKTAIYHVEKNNGDTERLDTTQDLAALIDNLSPEIQNIKVIRKNDLAITKIQSDFQSIWYLLDAGIMAMNSDANWDSTDNLLPLIEITNNAIKNLEEIKLKIWSKFDFELQGDLS